MADGDEISAAPDWIGEHGFVESRFGVRIGIAVRRRLVDRVGGFAPDRFDGVKVGDDGVEIVRQ